MKISEDLKKGIQKKKNKYISLLSKCMLIKHKPTNIEYTIDKVVFKDAEPMVIAYRYYNDPKYNKKVYIEIQMKDFKAYEAV
ncbi:hypothetical protein OAT38_00570 [Amylibacter sp.]|jgi:hypothetical protein|nr:hypothetical protein [Amylibacter sp.]